MHGSAVLVGIGLILGFGGLPGCRCSPKGSGGQAPATARLPDQGSDAQPSSVAAPGKPSQWPRPSFGKETAAERLPEAPSSPWQTERDALCEQIAQAVERGTPLSDDQRAEFTFDDPDKNKGKGPSQFHEYFHAVTCVGIVLNQSSACASLMGELAGDCRRLVAFYKSARNAPQDSEWRCDEHKMQKCLTKGDLSVADCKSLCTALRTGDPSKCPSGPLLAGCRGMASLDGSYCGDRKDCLEEVRMTKAIATGGLRARIADAQEEEKVFINAALGTKDACSPALSALRTICQHSKVPPKPKPEPLPPPPEPPQPTQPTVQMSQPGQPSPPEAKPVKRSKRSKR